MRKARISVVMMSILIASICALAEPQLSRVEDSPFGIHDPAVPELDRIEDVAATGAKWLRYAGRNGIVWDVIEPQKGRFDWAYHDQLYLATFRSGIKMFVTILSANRAYRVEHGYKPLDMDAYLVFLKKAVEHYDGDGIDDAPGSPVIDVWQIENEVDIFWKDTLKNYAELLKESYKIIKQANPQAKVAIAGVGGPEGFDGVNKFYLPLLEELARMRDNSGDRYFDIFDFHWFPFESQYDHLTQILAGSSCVYLKDYIKNINTSLAKYGYDNIPLFITETAQYSGLPNPPPWMKSPPTLQFHSEKKQALDLFKIYIHSLANGVKKLFWVTLTEWHDFAGEPNSVFDNVGLINNPLNDNQSHKKLAYYTYKKMTETLEGSDWDNIQTIQEKDGIYIYRFTKQGKPIWVAWNDNLEEKQAIIPGITSSQAKITETIPKYASGKEIVDYNTVFEIGTKTVNGGQVTITLEDIPVFVEEEQK